ncbi:MAG: hypothetical protein R3264_04765 [Anaerolineae bacterium]|nr:hypothetical protein [Anaerolineae bacterium]
MQFFTTNLNHLGVVLVTLVVLISCSAGSASEEDIASITALETQQAEPVVADDEAVDQFSIQVEETTSALESDSPLPTPETPAVITATEQTQLATEIVETVISSPLEKPQMAADEEQVEPLAGSKAAYDAVISDLAQTAGVSATDIRLLAMEAVDWSDASLGCPEEGMMYAQVITPGFLMTFEAAGTRYIYHTDQGSTAVLCQEVPVDKAPAPIGAPDGEGAEPLAGSDEAYSAAIALLVDQLGVTEEEIRLLSMEAVEWGDTSLGCPQEGFMYAQVVTPGFLMTFEAAGQTYKVHTDQGTNAVICDQN